MLRVAVVGCGKAGENHVREICALSEARLVAVCDVEPVMAEQLSLRYRVPRHYSDVEVMLAKEHPDVVHVATPPQSHVALAMMALDAGSDVLVEKPLAMDHAAAESLVQFAMARQRKLTIGYSYYFDPICCAMRTLVADGVLGDPIHVESYMGYAFDSQFGAPVFADSGHWVHALPGKLVHNVIDHLLNKVTEFVRSDRPIVMVHAAQRSPREDHAFDVPDEVRMMIADDAVTAYATFSAHARPVGHHLTVFGTRSTLHLDFAAGTLTERSTTALPGAIGRLSYTFDQSWQHLRAGGGNIVRFVRGDFHQMVGLRQLFSQFYACILDDGPPPIAYAEMLRVSAIADQVFAQVGMERRHSA